MGKIIREIGLIGSNNRQIKLNALFDTGAHSNHIAKKFSNGKTIDDIGVFEFGEETSITLTNGEPIIGTMIKLKLLKMCGIEPIKNPSFCLWDMKLHDVIIGARLMQQLDLTLQPSIKKISLP